MALETFFKVANRPGVEQVRQNQIQAQLDRKMANEKAQRNAIAELLTNRGRQIANRRNDLLNTKTALEMTQLGKPTFGDLVQQPDGSFVQPQMDRAGRVIGVEKVAGLNKMPTFSPDYEVASYLTEAEQREYLAPTTPINRRRALAVKGNVLKRDAKPTGPTFAEKEQIKREAKRSSDLGATSALRKTSLEQAKRFLGAFEGKEDDLQYFGLDDPFFGGLLGRAAESGSMRDIIKFLPVATDQGRFDQQLDAFAEQAARQLLQAAGEVRPTNEDVEGAKNALFGVGKDEQVNINLLRKYIAEQEAVENEFQNLRNSSMDLGGTRFTIEEE